MATAGTSQTAIVNAALAEMGSTARVTSINDGSNVANRAKGVWDIIVRFALVLHPWNHALRRAHLNEHGTAPVFGWARAYQLPADCLRWLPPAMGDDDWFAGECEGGLILTDAAAPLPIRYIALVEDVSKWSAGFAWLVKELLKESMADGTTQSEGISRRMEERAREFLRVAKRIDGLETGRRRRGGIVARSDWLGGRRRIAPQVGR